MASEGVPLSWNETKKRFTGVKGFHFGRVSTVKEGGFARVPSLLRRFETERAHGNPHPVVLFAMDARYGPNLEDTLVVMRMQTFTAMLREAVETHPNKYLGVE